MIGTVLGNRYELCEKVGMGGMAVVYKAKDRLLNRFVAVKLLRSEFQGNEEFIRRFNIESQAAASLSHANIVSIYDVGQSGELQYIVMEYIEGKTLKDYIAEKKGDIYWKEATDIAMQICSALEHAHSKHIIHRDIKPQNIMITTENVIKVTDFGIARAASGGTMTMEAMGSAHYLSPEQARGGYTDQRSDIYSFGIVLYELYTGKLPFDGETPVAVAMQHMQSEAVKPRNINEDIPQPIEDIILKAMSKEQRLRYESATQMLGDIKKAYADPESVIATEDEEDKFGTKKITPIVNITVGGDEGKTVVRRSEEERRVKEKKNSKRKDFVAIIAAMITCFIIACMLFWVTTAVINKNDNKEPPVTTYQMPHVKGMTETEMDEEMEKIREAGIEINEVYVFNPNVPEGEIVDQVPRRGEIITLESMITITISKGVEQINLDDYSGKEAMVAVNELEAMGIVVKTSEEMSSEVEEGYVIRQLPTAGQVIETGDSIRLFISSGAEKFKLADYSGEEAEDAKSELEQMEIKVSIISEYSTTVPSGIVVRQEPLEGTEMKKGDAAVLYVSLGAEKISVPNLLGLDIDRAKSSLTNLGLKVGDVKEIESGKEKGVVVKQSISEGEKVDRNTMVDIHVSKGNETEINLSDSGL